MTQELSAQQQFLFVAPSNYSLHAHCQCQTSLMTQGLSAQQQLVFVAPFGHPHVTARMHTI